MTVWAIDIWDGNKSQVQSFINRTGVTFPVLMKGSSVAATYCAGLEDFFVVDRNGMVTYISRDYDETSLQSHLENLTDVEERNDPGKPAAFRLEQNFPNPFNPNTRIIFEIPGKATEVELVIFNLRGEKVRTLEQRTLLSGIYETNWDGRDDRGRKTASGIYYYRMNAGDFTETRKMLLLR